VDNIKILSELDSRIDAADYLLDNHYNILPIFTYLEKNTLVDVELQEFSLSDLGSRVLVKARGQAADLTDLQLQSRAYTHPNVENIIFSNVTKSREGFSVFDLEFYVDKKFLTNRNFIINNN
jgi:hypothetical protein